MKYLVIIALIALFSYAYARSDHVYDWTEHKDDKQLYTALKDETDLIFILYWFKESADEEIKKKNLEIKDKIKTDVIANHPDIVYSEIDMTDATKMDSYKTLIEQIMQIDATKLDKGPIISVVNNGEGAWIHGKGTAKEVAESVDIFIHEAKDRRVGGTGYVYGSDKARKDGSVSVGGRR